MSIIEKEIVGSIMVELNHIVERIEVELGADVRFTNAQTKAMEAHNELRAYLAERQAKAA